MKVKSNIAISDSGFVFNPTSGDSYSVNEIGHLIIKLLQQGKQKNEIIDEILKTYKVDKNTVEKDLDDFCNMLSLYKLIE